MSERNILINLQQAIGGSDWEGATVAFELLTRIAILGNEVYPKFTGSVVTDVNGEATAVLTTPDTDAWQYYCTITPSSGIEATSFVFNLEAGGDVYLSELIADANLEESDNPGDIQAAIDAHVALPDPHPQYLLRDGSNNRFWIQPQTIVDGETVIIPDDHQMVIFGGLAIDASGQLIIEGSGGLVTPA